MDDRTVQQRGLLGAEQGPPRTREVTLEVLGTDRTWRGQGRCAVGSHPSNDLVLDLPTVSRLHGEIVIDEHGVLVRDLGSTNGTTLDGVRIREAWARDGSVVTVGEASLRVALGDDLVAVPLSERDRFGDLVGASTAARRLFALLERCAATHVTVLLEGETGTGKDLAADALHREGPRKSAPFVVIDCGAMPANLLESELFGHERGAFTGAATARVGAFQSARGGTVFLDEIGELPLDLQPKLLRALEDRTIRRLGATQRIPIDVRIVAATNRSLATEVNAGRFRSDLFYRLAVARIEVPPLRERLDDLPLLVDTILDRLGADPSTRKRLATPKNLAWLASRAWPGNLRELRNVLERWLVFGANERVPEVAPPSGAIDPSVPWLEARQRAIQDFERRYTEALLEAHEGNVSRAARAAGIDRVYLHRLLRRSAGRDEAG